MDKSFNDDELNAIMKEIEALEDEFSVETESTFEATSVMEELSQMSEEVAIPMGKKSEAQVISFAKEPPLVQSVATSVNFKIASGSQLDLNLEVAGQSVSIKISEGGLAILTDNGISFHVPLTEQKSAKKVA